MLFIPVRADVGDLLRRPYATIGVVLANVAVALLAGFHPDRLILRYDDFDPLQWITSVFSHIGPAHLIFNMVFLLGFGMVVEAFAGWWRFLLLYFSIAAVQGCGEQLLFSAGGSLGASGCIYGLLAAAYLWAPERRVTCFYWVWHSVGFHEVRVRSLAKWWIGWELVFLLVLSFERGSELLHIMGAAIGFGLAWLMLRRSWVDCDGEDWFSVRATAREPQREWRVPIPALPEGRDHVGEWVSYLTAASASVLMVAGALFVVFIVDWSRPDLALGKTLVGIGMMTAGAFLHRYWRNR